MTYSTNSPTRAYVLVTGHLQIMFFLNKQKRKIKALRNAGSYFNSSWILNFPLEEFLPH